MRITQLAKGSVRLSLGRCAQNINTQKRQLKHQDVPPDDYPSWELNYRYYGYNVFNHPRYTVDQERQWIDQLIRALIEAVENEPNRWHRISLTGMSGYQTGSGFTPDGQVSYSKSVTVLAFCKDRGVLPEFEKDADGLYVLPFNLPEGATQIPYDPDLPDWDGSGEMREKAPDLETTPVDPGTAIVVLDEWGLEVTTTEVV